jgi:hypothetical protein
MAEFSHSSTKGLDGYRELHGRALRLLARLNGLDFERMPSALRRVLMAQRADLEALVATTAPDAAPQMEAQLRARRPSSLGEMWEIVRAIDPTRSGK